MELDGTVIGKFGKPGKQLGEFSTVHAIDCRNPDELIVVGDHRVARAEDSPQADHAVVDQVAPRRRAIMTRALKLAALAVVLAACAARGAALDPRDSLRRRRSDQAARRHLSGRSGRRRDQLEGQHLRLHADRQSRLDARHTPHVRTRGGARLFEFDPSGKYVREIGQGLYGFLFAHTVRVDRQDNIWVVDEGSNMVIKFDPERPRA